MDGWYGGDSSNIPVGSMAECVCLCVIHATTIDHIRTSQSRPVFSVFCENCGLRRLAKKAQKAKKRQNHEILRNHPWERRNARNRKISSNRARLKNTNESGVAGRDGILRFLRKLRKNGNWRKRKEGEKAAKSRNQKQSKAKEELRNRKFHQIEKRWKI